MNYQFNIGVVGFKNFIQFFFFSNVRMVMSVVAISLFNFLSDMISGTIFTKIIFSEIIIYSYH